MKIHPVAQLFPMLSDAELREMADSIAKEGLLNPCVRQGGVLLDGRNRIAACKLAGVDPRFVEYEGDDVTGFIIGQNIRRRHLDESQRAMVAARLANLPRGSNQHASIDASTTQDESAQLLNVSRPSVQRARQVLDHGTPELIAAVDSGKLAVSEAAKVSKAAAKVQRAVVKKVSERDMSGAQAMREITHENRPAVDAPRGKFRVIYADPPWSYGNSGLQQYGHASHHYPSMTIEELCALPIADIAQDDAVLFLWVTSPLLEECFPVIKAWGFTYKTSFIWDKVKHNFGHYNSVRHEFLLVCTRGSCTPDVKELYDSVQTIERSETHSEKPQEFRSIIDSIYTDGSRVELFSRSKHKGWKSWGNEA